VHDFHAALKGTGTDPQEGDAVAVLGVHVGLDLEEKPEKPRFRLQPCRVAFKGLRGWGQLDELIQEEAHAKVGQGAAEEDRGLLTARTSS
jgi:hypothetical protein